MILYLMLPFASGAFDSEHQLLGGLGLLSQDRLRLTTKALLFAVVSEMEKNS
jgi:hypothetical protein